MSGNGRETSPGVRSPSRAVPVAVALLVGLGVVLAGVAAYQASDSVFRSQRERELAAIAALEAEQVARWRNERLASAQALAEDAADELGGSEARQPRLPREVAGWLRRLRHLGDCTSVALLGPEGAVRFAAGTLVLEAHPATSRSMIAGAIRRGEPFFSDLHEDAAGLHLDVMAPVGRGGPGAGGVILRIDPRAKLFPMIRSWTLPSESAETLLVRADVDGAVALNELRHRQGAVPQVRIALPSRDRTAPRPAQAAAPVLTIPDYRGVPALTAMQPVPGSPWAVVVKVDAAEAFGPLRERLAWAHAAVVALVLACAAAAASWWRLRLIMFERQRFAAVAERTALARKVDQLTRWTNDMVILADQELGIVDVTDRTAEALGYSREELLQMTLRDLIDPAALAEVDASGAPFAQRLLWASALRNEASPARGTGLWETRCRRKDGSTFPVEASVNAEEMGGRRYHHAIVRDVTDRLAAQEALRASEARFRAAFDGVSLGMVLLDPEGRILECNRAFREMLGLGDADLRGRLGREFLHPDDAASAFEDYGALKSGTRATVEASRRHVRADATLADTLVRLNPLRDGQGNFQYALAMVEDVSEKRRLEAQLRLADRMASVGTLAAGVAHEINNPLAFVLANLEYAIRELRHRGIGEEVVGALEEAREGGTRVREIVRDLKTFSRADDQAREVLDVPRVLRSTLTLASNEIRARARLDLQLGPTPPVLASEHRLGQVFLNLLINAAQAIPEGRPAGHAVRVVSGAARDGRALVEVSDDGVGIPAEIRGRIFDPFFTTKPVGVGTGLGLSICHGIVTALGGEIQVESEPGRGSTFRVLLPAAPADAAARAGVPTQLALGRRARVLVVDDEPLVCRAVQRILSPPHDVDTRSSARDALEVLRGPNGYDLILCDLMMPEMTGMDLHEQIHAASPGMAERFVFLTGGAYTANARDFLARVPNPRVEKPFDPMALRDLVARVLGGSSAPLG